jgi:bifunctional non-homologous end joining protein LigD
VIPQDQYGAGPVIQWDRGHWIPRGDPREGYAKGHLKFSLRGKKLGGDWNLVRVHPKAAERGDNWLLIKAADGAARARNERDILELFAQRPGLDRGRRLFDPGAAGGGGSDAPGLGRIRRHRQRGSFHPGQPTAQWLRLRSVASD